jgi:pimeloyl-ACP methyl ester carboxylesterase
MSLSMRTTPPIELYRATENGILIDRPSLGRFREPLDGPRPDGLSEVIVLSSSTIDPLCGWYEHDGRTVLLSQVPEAYWGEPLLLVQDGDTVRRAYAVGERVFIREDGEIFEPGGPLWRRTTKFTETEVSFVAGGTTLAGTLIAPVGPGPHAAVVALHGSSGGQRDYQRVLVGPALDAGLAVLIYDKQGHGRSGGDQDPTIFDQADAADAALDLLARTPGIDPARRGLLGLSNGMWAAPMVVARRDDVAFIAGVGSPGVSMAECEVHRRTKVLRDSGVGTQTLTVVAEIWRLIFGMAAQGVATDEDVDQLRASLEQLSTADDLDRYEIPGYVRENPMLAPYPPLEVPAEAFAAMVTAEASPELAYDPALDYARLHCPVFLQYGSNDVSVPVSESVAAVSAALPSAEIRVYPDLEHQLNVAPRPLSGLSAEEAQYLFHDFRFGAGVRDDLAGWLAARRF